MKISYKKLFKKRFFKKTGYISVCSKTFLTLDCALNKKCKNYIYLINSKKAKGKLKVE